MADSVTLDHRVATERMYDFALFFCNDMENENFSEDDTIGSIDNTCNYYSPEEFSNLDRFKTVSPFCINYQSITSHWGDLYDLLCTMNPGSNKLDFIGLTEVFHIH